MSLAFEITQDDVENVFRKNNKDFTEVQIDEAFDALDFDAIEKTALIELDFDDQVTAALLEIELQLKDQGLL
jgi:hypothetical protein